MYLFILLFIHSMPSIRHDTYPAEQTPSLHCVSAAGGQDSLAKAGT